MKGEAAVDDHVFLRIERIRKYENRRVIRVKLLAADGDAVGGPSNREAIGDSPIDGVARRIAEERQVVVGDVIRR